MENSFREISMCYCYSFVKKLQNSMKYFHTNGKWKKKKKHASLWLFIHSQTEIKIKYYNAK